VIDYKNWDSKGPAAKTIVDLGRDKKKKAWVPQRNHGKPILGKAKDTSLTKLQESCNVYDPIEAYEEEWKHDDKTGTGTPIEGTRQRSDLPPLYIQWKDDWKRRLNAKTTENG
tara:strand:- start:200 stop:538 length:339 start_codon:yes stop_codon:yes gene_type:complete